MPDFAELAQELATDARVTDNAAEKIEAELAEAHMDGRREAGIYPDAAGSVLTLTREQLGQLRKLVGSMPYGASLPRLFPRPRIGEYGTPAPTGEDLIRYLTGLRDRLVQAADSREANERALYELQAQRAAFRDFLGLPVNGTPTLATGVGSGPLPDGDWVLAKAEELSTRSDEIGGHQLVVDIGMALTHAYQRGQLQVEHAAERAAFEAEAGGE